MMHHAEILAAQGGGYGPPPGGYGPPGGPPPGAPPPGGYGPPGAPGGYGPPGHYGGPGPGAPMPPQMHGSGPGAPMQAPGGDIGAQSETWFIIAIVSMFVCCTGIFGAVGAIMAHKAALLAAQGQLAEAEAKLKTAKILTIVGAAFLAIVWILWGLWLVIGGGLAMMGL